jgi:hypothetical protein
MVAQTPDNVISIEAHERLGGPQTISVIGTISQERQAAQAHNDWLSKRLFAETTARHDAEFERGKLATRHQTVLARITMQDREIGYWQILGGWLLLAACTGWLAFGLLLLAYLRGL